MNPAIQGLIAKRLAACYRFAVAFPNSGDDTAQMDAAAMLEELAEAGFIIVRADRLERMRRECLEILGAIYPEGAMHLEAGDLEVNS